MIFVIILFAFNLVIIIILSNIKPPSLHSLFEYRIAPTMRLQNRDVRFSEIEINKYHSIKFQREIKLDEKK